MVDTLSVIKIRAPILLLQPLLPRAATNRHFGRMLTALVDVRGNFGAKQGREDQPMDPSPARLTRGDLQSGRNFT
jgi:hypothetical protein